MSWTKRIGYLVAGLSIVGTVLYAGAQGQSVGSMDQTTSQILLNFWHKLAQPMTMLLAKIYKWLPFGAWTASAEASLKNFNQAFAGNDASGISYWHFLLAFVAGWWVSLTPCIYPLIPVTASILSGSGRYSWMVQVVRAFAYMFGLAFVFAALGFLSAKTSIIFGQWMSSPWVIGFAVALFVYLAFSMFGFYDVSLGFKSGWQVSANSSIFSAMLFGGMTGVISSPCMTPPLLILLGFVSRTGAPVYGMLLLLSFALGMGSIIGLVAIFSGLLSSLPTPGAWMVAMKKLLGFLMLFMAGNMVSEYLLPYQIILMYGVLLLAMSLYYFYCSRKDEVLNVLTAHSAGSVQDLSVMDTFSLSSFVKKFFAVLLLLASLFFFVRAYTVYNNTTIKNILIKSLR